MVVLQFHHSIFLPIRLPITTIGAKISLPTNHLLPPYTLSKPLHRNFLSRATRDQKSEIYNIPSTEIEVVDEEGEDYDDGDDRFWSESGFRGREGEKDYDRDPEFAEIIGTSLDDPDKARSKVKLSYLFLVNRFFMFVFSIIPLWVYQRSTKWTFYTSTSCYCLMAIISFWVICLFYECKYGGLS